MQLTGHSAALFTLVETNAPEAPAALAAYEARIMAVANGFKDPENRRLFLEVPWTKRVMALRAATRPPA